MNTDLSVLILAAGLGTRMRSRKAKVLHKAGGDTLLNQVIRAARTVCDANRIVAVVGHQGAAVRASVWMPDVLFAEQQEQKGTGHAVLCAKDVVPLKTGLLIILNGDGPLLQPDTLQSMVECAGSAEGGCIVTTEVQDATGYGRIVRDEKGMVGAIVEQKMARAEHLTIREINPGVYCFNAELFWKHVGEIQPNNAAKEYYLTDMVEILTHHGYAVAPLMVEDETELLGINTRVELAVADKILRARKAHKLMLEGVTMENPATVTIDPDVEVGQDSVLEAGVQLRGRTKVGSGCHVGAGAILKDCEIDEGLRIPPYVVANGSHMDNDSDLKPFAVLMRGN